MQDGGGGVQVLNATVASGGQIIVETSTKTAEACYEHTDTALSITDQGQLRSPWISHAFCANRKWWKQTGFIAGTDTNEWRP